MSSSHCIPSDFMLYCLLLCFLRGILSEQLRILGSPGVSRTMPGQTHRGWRPCAVKIIPLEYYHESESFRP